MRLRTVSFLSVLVGLLLLPHAWLAGSHFLSPSAHWTHLGWGSAGVAPDPEQTPEAIVQVYAARAHGWRGIFADHTWLVLKKPDAPTYARYEVVGWGLAQAGSAVRINMRAPDGYWAGNSPRIIAELRGAEAESAIEEIEAAIERYQFADRYRIWPGPNSNSFVAYVAREVPELKVHFPPTAIGKDFLPGGVFARTPSGTGYQVSLYGLAGVSIARIEGFELNLLGLTLGIDPMGLAVKLPGVGRVALNGPGA